MASTIIFCLKNLQQIKNILINAFKSHFNSYHTSQLKPNLNFLNSIINANDCNSFLAPVTMNEIKYAFFYINRLKAPGSNDFGSKSYQVFLSIICKEISVAVQKFFHHRKLPPSLTHTHS